jgi:trehalose 6-phosphate phosphatase
VTTTAIAGDAIAKFTVLDLTSVALLFDVDGTLIDIGPTPQNVNVPETLRRALGVLAGKTDGALALVSGRPIADLDRLFAPLTLSIVGGHGAEMRICGRRVAVEVKPLPPALRRLIAKDALPGTLVEDKDYSLAVHFRAVPDEQTEVRRRIAAALTNFPDENIELLGGKDVIELKRPGIDKGRAVRTLLGHAPFKGRKPVFVGDDVTDNAVFEVLPQLGGIGFSVGRRVDGLAAMFETPSDVRTALCRLAGGARTA